MPYDLFISYSRRDNEQGRITQLDNVELADMSKPSLLDPALIARLDVDVWLHILATTRLGENELHGAHRDRSFLAIDELPPDDALALIPIFRFEPFFNSQVKLNEFMPEHHRRENAW